MSESPIKTTPVQENSPPPATKRAIEEYFPIVEINRLAIPERNSFKPIYQMHKWFARRASCVFRAILLGALKPAGTDIMEDFYKDHTNDPDTNGKMILDPFMGGGTTVVEALRLGCKVIGIDLNPVAWFIVKTEVEPVDIDQLRSAFHRLTNRKTPSGLTVREDLLSQYKTECPACGNLDADIIYVFWVKSAICTNPEHPNEQVPLFSDYLITQKIPSIMFFPDAQCPRDSCMKTFDWEIEPASLVGEARLMVASTRDGAGEGRGNRRWTYSAAYEVTQCPWCGEDITPKTQTGKPQRKKVPLSILYCPHCATVFQFRGTLPDEIRCPGCSTQFAWQKGNVPHNGQFQCPRGHRDAIIDSVRRHLENQLLPNRMYAIEGFCSSCGGVMEDEEEENHQEVLAEVETVAKINAKSYGHGQAKGLLWKNKGKFFKSISPSDERRYREAGKRWDREQENLPYPRQEVPAGYNTNQMIKHNYRLWHQLFNPRQLFCLATLLDGIRHEEDQSVKETLLSAFTLALNNNNMFCRFHRFSYREGKIEGIFSRHDYQPKATSCEANCWGVESVGYGSFTHCLQKVIEGKVFGQQPFDWEGKSKRFNDPVSGIATLECASSANGIRALGTRTEYVITDPPYAGNVNYSELSDFFYVWLRLVLAASYPSFAPEVTPKADEIIENKTRGKTLGDFKKALMRVFANSKAESTQTAPLIFTFHHSDESAWEALLEAVCEAGWAVQAVYPIHGEAENSLQLLSGSNIAYDLIHVCQQRDTNATLERRAWATIKTEIRREARKEIERIERDVYGNNRSISPADKLIILTGKCLQLYSRHYNAVVDHVGRIVSLKEALEDIRMLVDQLVSVERPLPAELHDIDRPSYVYLTALSEKKEIKSDELHKATRGIIEIDELLEAGLMKRGRAGRGRTYEVKTPIERFPALLETFKDEPAPQPGLFAGVPDGVLETGQALFIDRLHFLMGLAEGGENLRPWIERWRGEIPQIRAAAEYLLKIRKDFAPALKRILAMIDVGPLRFE